MMGPIKPRVWFTMLAAALALIAAACTSSPSDNNADQATSTEAPPATSAATSAVTASTETETTQAPSANEVVAEAVDSLAEVGTYSFEAKILLSVQEQLTEVDLEGWVDGSDRELVMRIDQQEVTTRVIDGVATVERDGETTEVPLTEAGSAPSILILKEIRNATFESDGAISGELDTADLASSDYELTGSAAITVRITSDGTLSGYSMTAEDDSWSVDVEFSDVGESPR